MRTSAVCLIHDLLQRKCNSKDDYWGKWVVALHRLPTERAVHPRTSSIYFSFRVTCWPLLTHHGLEGFGSQVVVVPQCHNVEKVSSGQTLCCTHREIYLIHSIVGGLLGWGDGEGQA